MHSDIRRYLSALTSRIGGSLGNRLRRDRVASENELLMHDVLASCLSEMGVRHKREVNLSALDRADFVLSDGIVIELKKTSIGLNDLRQLGRYLDHEIVTGGILIGKRAHDAFPDAYRGKPIAIIELWRFLL